MRAATKSCRRTMCCAGWRSTAGSTACGWNMRPRRSPPARPSPRSLGWVGSPARSCYCAGAEEVRVPEISVVVPAYAERDNIVPLLGALEQALAGIDWETIVVVDDAFDGTEDVVREHAQRDSRVRCLHRIGRRGLASAC